MSLKLVFTILFLLSSSFAGAEISSSCRATAVDDANVRGRAKSVRFPDGRIITVVGHLHGKRQIYDLVELVDSGQLSKMSDREFNTLLSEILKENKVRLPEFLFGLRNVSTLEHAKNDYAYIQQLLTKNSGRPAIEFIGFEGTPYTARNNPIYFMRAARAILWEYDSRQKRRKLSVSKRKLREVLLSSMNANSYAYIESSKLRSRVSLIGTESEEAGNRHDKADPHAAMESAFKALLAADEAHWKTRSKAEQDLVAKSKEGNTFQENLVKLYADVTTMKVNSIEELETRAAFLRGTKYYWLNDGFKTLIATMRQRIIVNLDRDRDSALNLVSQYQSGVHFVGLNHLENTISNLEILCSQETKRAWVPLNQSISR